MIDIEGITSSLNVDTKGLDAKLAAARLGMQQLEAEIARVEADLKRMPNGANLQPLLDRVNELTRRHQDLAAAMANAYGKVGTAKPLDIASQMEKGAAAAARYARGLMQLGYVTDDIQYGFKSIVNNIAPLVFGMTGNAGLAGAAQIAAVEMYQLSTRWDEFREALGDTSKMEAAKQSLEGMVAAVKKLKEEASSTSWGDSFAWLLGLNSDAGKAQRVELMEPGVKARQEAEANAKSIEGHRTEGQQKTARRFDDAIAEAGGMDMVQGKVAENLMAQGGLARFLSTDRTWGGLGSSLREEYQALIARPKAERTAAERSRIEDLEAQARMNARGQARQVIGGARYNADAQRDIGDVGGGEAGDLIAGRVMTERERKEAEKEGVKGNRATSRAEAAELARQRKWAEDNAEFAERVSPGVAKSAELEVAKARVAGRSTAGLVDDFTARLARAGMSRDDAAEAAQGFVRAGEKTYDRNPNAAREKLEKEERERAKGWEEANAQLAETVSPGAAKAAEEAVARAKVAGKSIDAAMTEITQRLTDAGLSAADARAAAKRFVREGLERYNKDPKAAADRLEREAESERRDRWKDAEKLVPGLKEFAQHEARSRGLAGLSMDATIQQIRGELTARGMTADRANATAKETAEDAKHAVQKEAGEKLLKAMEELPEVRRRELLNARSEVFSTSDLTRQVQQGVGQKSEAQRQTEEIVKLRSEFTRLADRPGLIIGVRS